MLYNHAFPSLSHYHLLQDFALAREDGRAGVLVRSRDGVVDVDEDTRVTGRVGAGEGNLRRGLGAAAAGNFELGARDVELGTALALGHVQGHMLSAEEVAAGGNAGGDGDVERALALRVC